VGAAARSVLSSDAPAGSMKVNPAVVIKALEKILSSQEAQIGVTVVSDLSLLKSMLHQGRYLEEITAEGVGNCFENDVSLFQDLRSISSREERTRRIRLYIEEFFRRILNLLPSEVLDSNQNFLELGVDSLIVMEIKNRFQQKLLNGKQTLSLSATQKNQTIQSLSSHLAEFQFQ
jgi:aryl carrier-like protein